MMTPANKMNYAIEQAELAWYKNEVPVGAVIVDNVTHTIIASSHNLTETIPDPTAHAEILAIREACRVLDNSRLVQCDMYVTLEPCPMCAQAIAFARIRRLYFGAYDPKGGGVEHGACVFHASSCHHKPEIIAGIQEMRCAQLLKDFFSSMRRK